MTALVVTLVNLLALVAVIAPRSSRTRAWEIVRGLRPVHFLTNLPVLVVMTAAYVALNEVPALQWGWWKLVSGQSGNVTVSGLTSSAGWWLLAPSLVVLVVAVPLLAETEEWMFREGTRGWWPSAVIRSVLFGLIHLTAGVPISAALALTIAGLWFTRQYMRGGMELSTRYHTAWNYTAITALVVVIGLSAVTS